jgi:hypothetical protein
MVVVEEYRVVRIVPTEGLRVKNPGDPFTGVEGVRTIIGSCPAG